MIDSKFKKPMSVFLIAAMWSLYELPIGVFASEITTTGTPFNTNTKIINRGNQYDITSGTTFKNGTVGLNNFSRFNVTRGDIVNLNLTGNQNKLVNLVFDDKASTINGIVNSYMTNGKIGGNILFANPNGFVVGESGVFNVGSLTLMTPTREAMEDMFYGFPKKLNEGELSKLVSFTMDGNDYLINGDSLLPVKLNPAQIKIDGKINSGSGIDIISGGTIDIGATAELNSNMNFSVADSVVTATKKSTVVTPNTSADASAKTLAMNGGNGIIIVAQNSGEIKNNDYLGAIVNLNGKVDSNGGDIYVKSELRSKDKFYGGSSEVNINSGSDIRGNNVNLSAITDIDKSQTDALIDKSVFADWLDFIPEIGEGIAENYYHYGDLNSSVTVNDGASITAADTLNIDSAVKADMKTSGYSAVLDVSVNEITSNSNAIVKSGSALSAKNLNVKASNDVSLVVNNAPLAAGGEKNPVGSAVVTFTNLETNTRAEVQKDVTLSVDNDMTVAADSKSYYTESTSNEGWVPSVSSDNGAVGAGFSLLIKDATTEAILNSDTDINGDLKVSANYAGNNKTSLKVNAAAEGETGTVSKYGKTFVDVLLQGKGSKLAAKHPKIYDKIDNSLNDIKNRGDASFNKFEAAGGIAIALDDVNTNAKIGDKKNNIKPTINAGTVELTSKSVDDKSDMNVIVTASNGKTSAGGAVAVNKKNINANSDLYSDVTVTGNYTKNVFTANSNNTVTGTFYKVSFKNPLGLEGLENLTKIYTEEEYNQFVEDFGADNFEQYYDVEQLDSAYQLVDKDGNITYSANAQDAADYNLESGSFYKKGDIFIPKSVYDKLSPSEQDDYELVASGENVYSYSWGNASAVKVDSDTEILHPLSYYDWWPSFAQNFKDIFTSTKWSDATSEMKASWDKMDFYETSPSSYLQYIKPLSNLSTVFDSLNFDLISSGIGDTKSFGLKDLFNTYAQAAVDAKTPAGETKALAGAISAGVFDTNAISTVVDGSTITVNASDYTGDVSVTSNTNNEVWSMASLINPAEITDAAKGAGARDGSGYGAGISFAYSDSVSKAIIGENVTIKDAGVLDVLSNSSGNYSTISVGSSNADESGFSGSVGLTIAGGETSSYVSKNSDLTVDKLNVNSDKDANYINGTLALGLADEAKGFGISGIYLYDTVSAVIDGIVNAQNVNLNANYDKLLANIGINASIAKSGTDAPQGKVSSSGDTLNSDDDDSFGLNDTFLQQLFWEEDMTKWQKVKSRISRMEEIANEDFDFERKINPDKKTTAYAGGINGDLVMNAVEARIGSHADIQSTGDIKVSASSNDLLINASTAVSANGKSGAGAALLFDAVKNNVKAGIDSGAKADAAKALNINAKENFKTVQAAYGIAQAKDSSGAGNVSNITQANNVSSYINGAQINQRTTSTDTGNKVKLNAENDSLTVKAVGAVSVQAGTSTSSSDKKAAGATIDGDVSLNNVSAYIKDSTVSAANDIEVNAANSEKLIAVDIAAAAATGAGADAYSGVIAANVNSNNVDAHIDNSTIKKANNLKLSADNYFNEIIVGGVGAGGNDTSVGATVRVDVIANDINSYINKSTITAQDVTLTNSETVKQVSVMATGSGSSKGSAGAGVVSSIFAFSDQNNYITGSTINSDNLTLNSNKTMDTVAVTGALAVGLGGKSLGGSLYVAGASYDMNTYIEDSVINAVKNVVLNSMYDQDYTGVTIGGAGGSGFSGSGAATVLVNNGNIDTHIGSKDKNTTVNADEVKIDSKTDIDTLTVNGQVSVSTSGASAGGAVNTTVYNSDINSEIINTSINTNKGLLVNAEADSSHLSTIIGASGGSSTAVDGSIDTLVMNQDVKSVLKDSTVKTDGYINVKSKENLSLGSAVGAVAASTSGASVGGSILTATMTGNVLSSIDNVDVYSKTANNDVLGSLLVDAVQSDRFDGATIAGSVGTGASVAGTVDTIVINKDIAASVNDLNIKKNDSDTVTPKFSSAKVNSSTTTYLGHGTGQVSVAAEGTGVGGAVSTLVLNKDVTSSIANSNFTSNGKIENLSNADIDILSVALGFGAGSSAAINGTAVTQVLNVDTLSEINGSTLSAVGELVNKSINTTDLDMYLASANGAGTAAIGGVVYTLVDNSSAKSNIIGSTINNAASLENSSDITSNYLVTLFNASGAGTAAVNGTVNTIVLNTNSASVIDSTSIGNTGNILVQSNNNSNDKVVMLQASGAGTAAVNGGVNSVISTKKSTAKIANNSSVSSTGNVKILAASTENIDSTVVGGAGSGTAAVTGAVNTIVSSNTVNSSVENSSVETSVAAGDDNGVILNSNDTLTIVGRTGSAAGSGGVAAGGAVITGVVTNSVISSVSNSDINANNANVIISSVANETLGSSDNPFLTIAATGSGNVAVSGAIDTLVLNSSSKSLISGKKTDKGIQAQNGTVKLDADGNTTLYTGTGAGSGSGVASVGATVSTLVVNKDIEAVADSTKISSNNLAISADAVDNFNTYSLAGSGAGTAGVAGVTSTNVISSTVKSGVRSSVVSANDIDIKSNSNAKFVDAAGAAAGGGIAGVGATVAANIISYKDSAFIDNSTVSDFNTVNVNALGNSTFDFNAVSGGAGGVAGVGGVIQTNIINNEVKAYAAGTLTEKTGANSKLAVSASDTATYGHIAAGTVSAGSVGVGATISTNKVTSTVLSYIGGNITADDVDVTSNGIQDYTDMYVMGFSGGGVAVSGSALSIINDATVKAYTADNSSITSNSLDITAENKTDIDETIGTFAGAKIAAVGASVGVNKISNTVQAYTGKNNTISAANNINISAKSTNNIGHSDDKISVYTGSGAEYAGVAGSVLVNYIEDDVKAFIGTSNNISGDAQTFAVSSEANSNIYEDLGGIAVAGLAGVGASVGVNVIGSTSVASIGSNSEIILNNAEISVNALSNEKIDAETIVVGGSGVGALSGGVLYNTIGQKVANANANKTDDSSVDSIYTSAKNQADEILSASSKYESDANSNYKSAYNTAKTKVSGVVSDAQTNANNSIETGLNSNITGGDKNANAGEVSTVTVEQPVQAQIADVFTKSEQSGSSYGSTNRDNTTSAFVDTGAKISAKDLSVTAKNTNDVDVSVSGDAYAGLAAVGVAAGISNVKTTTNAFISNNVAANLTGKATLKSESIDNQDVTTKSAAGGIVSGSGAVSKIVSDKTTNAYILGQESGVSGSDGSVINAGGNVTILASAQSRVNSIVDTQSNGGVSVGVSQAIAQAVGSTAINIGNNVSISANKLDIDTISKMTASADADAAVGSLLGGAGADAQALTGQNNKITIGNDIIISANDAITIDGTAENTSTAVTDGRAYGIVSAGGTSTSANVDHQSGVNISDASSAKTIKGKSIKISSTAKNNVDAKTNAGAGGIAGVSGSKVSTNINSNNETSVGKNYNVTTTDGNYVVAATNDNTYKSYNNSSAYGVVGVTAGIIENTVNSTAKVTSNADVISNGTIELLANNNITKNAVNNYDLLGGAGGVAGVGAASLKDDITAVTYTNFGGNKALANGANDSGYITIASQSDINVNEKVDVNAGGAVSVADGVVKVSTNSDTQTNITNKNIQTKDDDITYVANSDVKIYTKSDVKSYGGIAVADGSSSAISEKTNNKVTFDGVKSVSGRDTYVQSNLSKNLKSYMYAETDGFIGAVGGSTANVSNKDSNSEIVINSNSALKSYDSMNVEVSNSNSALYAHREAKGTTRALFGIPITIHGKGHENVDNSGNNAKITLNGSLESGLGSNKSLVLNKDSNGKVVIESNGITYTKDKAYGEVTVNDINEDIKTIEEYKKAASDNINSSIAAEETKVDNAQKAYNEAEKDKIAAQTNKDNYDTAVTSAETIIKNKETISGYQKDIDGYNKTIDGYNKTLDEYNSSLKDYDNVITECGKQDATVDTMTAYITELNNTEISEAWTKITTDDSITDKISSLNTAVTNLKTTVETNKADVNTAIENLNDQISSANDYIKTLNDENTNELGNITSLSGYGNYTIEKVTDNFKNNLSKVSENWGQKIKDYLEVMGEQKAAKEQAENRITNFKATQAEIEAAYDKQIADLETEKNGMTNGKLEITALTLDDVVVRSGETNITGAITGSGSITAPDANDFSISIINNTVSNIVYNKLAIDRNVKGGIYGASGFANKTLRNADKSNDLSIIVKNTVDANSPLIDKNNSSGDMVFYKSIENVLGDVTLENWTGSILTKGGITAKNLKISAPNGDYTQEYNTNTFNAGGNDGTGSIVAAGDIDIASKIININGLIQSGSDIKSVTIPEFTVVKKSDGYYQVVNGVQTKMEVSPEDKNYYYINVSSTGDNPSDLQTIKAYFKPDTTSDSNNVQGDIYLFRAEIEGGNITLTGNIVSDNGNGKIVLINGYGHIDVVNNSNYKLVTSTLSADANLNGKLTINDFKMDSTTDTQYDNITQTMLTDSYIKSHSSINTVQVAKDGTLEVTKSGDKQDGNGSIDTSKNSKTTASDGRVVYTTSYTPGDDAYVMTKAGQEHSYQKYVKRSWWKELWYGKKYVTVTWYEEPVYEVKQSPVAVQIKGYTAPKINVVSNSAIEINDSINALAGDVSLTSKNGSITQKSNNYILSANNINLSAAKDLGSKDMALKTDIYGDSGKLTAAGDNVYINFPNTNINNVNINANNQAYLSTYMNQIGSDTSVISIKAKDIQLNAINGDINLNQATNNKIDISVDTLSAYANGTVSLTNNNDLLVGVIRSYTGGDIFLESLNGSILAKDPSKTNNIGEYVAPEYNIYGENVRLIAENGSIGGSDGVDSLKLANNGILYAKADGDINITSPARLYVDFAGSTSGSVDLDADYGVIASNSTDDLVYNILSKTGVNLNSKYGNIENIAVNTDGVINATAGYDNGTKTGISDISIYSISKAQKSAEEVENMTEDEYNTYLDTLKDMKIGTIKASNNVTLKSERSVYNYTSAAKKAPRRANSTTASSPAITGEQILVAANNGYFGDDSSSIKVSAGKDISIFAKEDVNLSSDDELNIRQISSANGDVAITTNANITNAAEDYYTVTTDEKGNTVNVLNEASANIVAKNISLNTNGNDIGTEDKSLKIETVATDTTTGLSYDAADVYIKGTGSALNVVEANSTNSTLTSSDDTNISIQSAATGNLNIDTNADVSIVSAEISNNLNTNSANLDITNANVTGNADITTTGDTTIGTASVGGDLTANADNMSVTDKLTTTGNAAITTTNKTTIANAEIGGNLTNTSTDTEVTGKLTTTGDAIINAANSVVIADADVKSSLDIDSTTADITNATVAKNADITTSGDTTIGTASVGGDLTANANNLTVKETLTTTGDAAITTTNKTTIANAEIGGNLTNASTDTEVTGKLTTTGDAIIEAANSVVIANADVKSNLDISSTTADITNATLAKNADITTSGDTTIGMATVGGDLTANADNLSVADKLTTTGDAAITTTNKTTIANAEIGGNLTNTSTDTEVTGKLTTTGDAIINAANSVVIADADVKSNLDISSTTADITNATVAENAEIATSGDTTIGTTSVGGDLTANADNMSVTDKLTTTGNAAITTTNKTTIANAEIGGNLTNTSIDTEVTGKLTTTGDAIINAANSVVIADADVKSNLDISSTTADIKNATVAKNADITTSGDTTIGTASVGGDLTANADNLSVIDKLTTTGNAGITTTNKTTIANAEIGGNLTNTSIDTEVTGKLTTTGDAIITTTNKTTIANVSIGGNLNNKSKNTVVTDTLNVNKNANITSKDSIAINNANISGDLNASAKNITIDEIALHGNVNASVDNLKIETSNDINIGSIAGNTKSYTENANISSGKSILNGIGVSDTNIYGKKITLSAGNSTGSEDKSMNLKLVNGNKLSLTSEDGINLSNSGAIANYDNISAKKISLASDNALNINSMNVDQLNLTTKSTDVNLTNTNIKTKATIQTADKTIIVDNTSLKPYQDATLQLYLTDNPLELHVNGSNKITTQSINAARHGINIYVDGSKDDMSMQSELTTSAETGLKNTNVSKKLIEKSDKTLDSIPTVNSYVVNVIDNNINGIGKPAIIYTYKNDIINPGNVMDVINTSIRKTNLSINGEETEIDYNKLSLLLPVIIKKGEIMKTKIKSLVAAILVFGTLLGVNSIAKADTAGVKVAVVDVPAVVATSKQVKALKDEQIKKAQELQKWLETVRADIAKQTTKEAKDKLTKKYDAELMKKKEANTQEYTKKLAEIDANITSTIVNQAKARGYGLVLTKSTVLYGGDDITAEIEKVVK